MNELFRRNFSEEYLETFCSGVFSDTLDKLGYRSQVCSGWMMNKPNLRLFGRVRTLTLETVETPDERISVGLGFLAGLQPDDVLVVKGSDTFAYFGELMSRLSQRIGLAGVVIDGLTRDTYYTQQIDLPIFARGYTPVDIKGRGRVSEVDVPVTIQGVKVSPGDIVFGDSDALVYMPAQMFETALPAIRDAVITEERTKEMIFKGTTIEDILKIVKEF